MKPRLLILSDLWGFEASEWLELYRKNLQEYFEIKIYDCCDLGNIDKLACTENALHKQFVTGGIEIAKNKLIKLEPRKVSILGFSIGGLIAWKAGLEGLSIEQFYAVSSTRLRYENQKPNCAIKLYFAELDLYKPEEVQLQNMKLVYEIIADETHQMYSETNFIQKISNEIIQNIKNSKFEKK
jgi:hypothetical protein